MLLNQPSRHRTDPVTRVPRRLHARLTSRGLLPVGAPFAIAPTIDRALEWWARRTPRGRTVLGIAVALLMVGTLARPSSSGWEPVSSAWVATRLLPAGHVLEPGDLARVDWPRRLLPPEPIGTGAEPAGARLAVGLPAGTALAAGHLQGPTLADLAPADTVVVAVPTAQLPDIPVGATVDLHGGDGASVRGAVVLDRSADVLWLAVPRAQAAVLADALAWGDLLVGIVSSAG